MCYSGRCKYEQYYGDCDIRDSNYPEDADCVIAETEILKHYYEQSKNDFQYLIAEAVYKEKVIKKLENNPLYQEHSDEDKELSVFIEISNIMTDEKLKKEYERI